MTMRTNLEDTKYEVRKISILDGVLYIKSKNKMHVRLNNDFDNNESYIISYIIKRLFIFIIK